MGGSDIDFCKNGIASLLIGHFPFCGLADLRPAQRGGVTADIRNGQVGGPAACGGAIDGVTRYHAVAFAAAEDDVSDTVFYDVGSLFIPVAFHPYEVDGASVAHLNGDILAVAIIHGCRA